MRGADACKFWALACEIRRAESTLVRSAHDDEVGRMDKRDVARRLHEMYTNACSSLLQAAASRLGASESDARS